MIGLPPERVIGFTGMRSRASSAAQNSSRSASLPRGRSTEVAALPQGNDWTRWNTDETRAAVEHPQRKLG